MPVYYRHIFIHVIKSICTRIAKLNMPQGSKIIIILCLFNSYVSAILIVCLDFMISQINFLIIYRIEKHLLIGIVVCCCLWSCLYLGTWSPVNSNFISLPETIPFHCVLRVIADIMLIIKLYLIIKTGVI
jgi:hypothetical protein